MPGEAERRGRRAVVAEGRACDQGHDGPVRVLDGHDQVVARRTHPGRLAGVRRRRHVGVLEEVEPARRAPAPADDDLEHAAVAPVQLGAEDAGTALLVLRQAQLVAGRVEMLGEHVVVGLDGVRRGRAVQPRLPLRLLTRGERPVVAAVVGSRAARFGHRRRRAAAAGEAGRAG